MQEPTVVEDPPSTHEPEEPHVPGGNKRLRAGGVPNALCDLAVPLPEVSGILPAEGGEAYVEQDCVSHSQSGYSPRQPPWRPELNLLLARCMLRRLIDCGLVGVHEGQAVDRQDKTVAG